MQLNLSIIIIGRNVHKTLDDCISSVHRSISRVPFVSKVQIVYVDSSSDDLSIEVAKKHGLEIYKIETDYVTAAMGRFIGLRHSKNNTILFLDGDMELDQNWFRLSLEYYLKYGAIHGDRHEKVYVGDIMQAEIERFYDIKTPSVSTNIGGCFMIRRELIGDINFCPILKDEEERDFYARLIENTKIYAVPVPMFIHNNYKTQTNKVFEYLSPQGRIGYLISFFNAVKHSYFSGYLRLQWKYLLTCILSVLYSCLCLLGYFGVSSLPFIINLFIWRVYPFGGLATFVSFPYKFLCAIYYYRKFKNFNLQYVRIT